MSADELVRCAVDAATAYENILKAIKAAEDAADKATSASESAFQVGICPGTFTRRREGSLSYFHSACTEEYKKALCDI